MAINKPIDNTLTNARQMYNARHKAHMQILNSVARNQQEHGFPWTASAPRPIQPLETVDLDSRVHFKSFVFLSSFSFVPPWRFGV
jgi:hypothetical protein